MNETTRIKKLPLQANTPTHDIGARLFCSTDRLGRPTKGGFPPEGQHSIMDACYAACHALFASTYALQIAEGLEVEERRLLEERSRARMENVGDVSKMVYNDLLELANSGTYIQIHRTSGGRFLVNNVGASVSDQLHLAIRQYMQWRKK